MIEYAQHKVLPTDYVENKIREFLAEDSPAGDATADAIFTGNETVEAYAEAEEDLIFAGALLIDACFGRDNVVSRFEDGRFAPKGSRLAVFTGGAKDVLRKERVFLNLIQRLSGIAGMTRKYVDICSPYGTKVLDTRKTTPGLRLFEKYAVACGGGTNHRLDLSSGILIKDNHINAAGGVARAIQMAKSAGKGLAVEVEVEDLDQLTEALEVGADGFLLDNMSPETTVIAVSMIRNAPGGEKLFVESSGGINLDTVESYAKTGVNAVSVGALTHGVKNANIHLEFIQR